AAVEGSPANGCGLISAGRPLRPPDVNTCFVLEEPHNPVQSDACSEGPSGLSGPQDDGPRNCRAPRGRARSFNLQQTSKHLHFSPAKYPGLARVTRPGRVVRTTTL